MRHRHYAAFTGADSRDLYGGNYGHHTGGERGCGGHGLWHSHQSPAAGSARSDEGCGSAVYVDRRAEGYGLCHQRSAGTGAVSGQGIIESRDGTIMDVVRQIKPFTFSEETGDGQ